MTRKLESLDDGALEARAELLKRIRDLLDTDLSDWEEEFLERMEMLTLQGQDLSPGQMEKIDEIDKGEHYFPY
jgi:hypothetical protein